MHDQIAVAIESASIAAASYYTLKHRLQETASNEVIQQIRQEFSKHPKHASPNV